MSDTPAIRVFDTGASRDNDTGKLDYEAFLSPAVLRRFAEYMHRNRQMADGSLRAGDNWQKGMAPEVYMKSLTRHHMELWLAHRGEPHEESIEDSLCAIMFNAMGLLYERLHPRDPA